MNKKIKIIELLNLIANKEEIPRHIKYEYYQYDWSDNANNYICEDADGERLSMFDDGYICILCNSLNDEVEILEYNTEEIEEIKEISDEYFNMLSDESKVKWLKSYIKEDRNKINELVRAVKKIQKKSEDKQ